MPGRPGLTAVVVGVNGSVLTTGRDKDGKMYAASATILARFVGPDGKEITRRSQKYQFTGEMAKREESLNRMVIFFRTPELPAGRQTLEAAVYDEMGERSTVLRIPIDVPAAAPVLIGDLFVVSHTERVEAGQPQFADHPLVWQGALLYPSFGEPIRKSVARELTFALPMVAAGGASAVLELRQGSKALASLPLPAEAPGSDGRLTIVGRLPLEHVPPGAYELALKVTAGQATATRSAGFTILD